MIYTILSPSEITIDLATRLKTYRLAQNLTQSGLADRSGVPLGTLKKFEGSGVISLLSFVRLLMALDLQDGLEELLETKDQDATLDQMLAKSKLRQRGRRA